MADRPSEPTPAFPPAGSVPIRLPAEPHTLREFYTTTNTLCNDVAQALDRVRNHPFAEAHAFEDRLEQAYTVLSDLRHAVGQLVGPANG